MLNETYTVESIQKQLQALIDEFEERWFFQGNYHIENHGAYMNMVVTLRSRANGDTAVFERMIEPEET